MSAYVVTVECENGDHVGEIDAPDGTAAQELALDFALQFSDGWLSIAVAPAPMTLDFWPAATGALCCSACRQHVFDEDDADEHAKAAHGVYAVSHVRIHRPHTTRGR